MITKGTTTGMPMTMKMTMAIVATSISSCLFLHAVKLQPKIQTGIMKMNANSQPVRLRRKDKWLHSQRLFCLLMFILEGLFLAKQ